jgi:hypothetical protein
MSLRIAKATAVIDEEVPALGMMKIVQGVESNCGSLHSVRHGGLRSDDSAL